MDLELWAVRLDRPLTDAETAALLARLPEERRKRLLRTKGPESWREPLCAYALLGLALRERCRWQALPPMGRDALGKPYFPDWPQVHFNLSHTAGAVLVGLCDRPLGVDIQVCRPVSRRMRERLSEDGTEEGFFRSWVRREARAKRTGAGIGSFLGPERPLEPGETFAFLEIFPGYLAGVSVSGGAQAGPLRKRTLEQLLAAAPEDEKGEP